MPRYRLLLGGLAVATLLGVSACGPAASTCTVDGAVVDILDNHQTSGGDHQLDVTAADVNAGAEISYDIRGDNNGHTHELTVTEADFTALQEGTQVTIESSDTGAAGNDHTHEVELSCP